MASFALVAWKGKDPTWSIISGLLVDGTLVPEKSTYALWGKKKYECEILAIAGKYLISIIKFFTPSFIFFPLGFR